jgi:hypothetical protein
MLVESEERKEKKTVRRLSKSREVILEVFCNKIPN